MTWRRRKGEKCRRVSLGPAQAACRVQAARGVRRQRVCVEGAAGRRSARQARTILDRETTRVPVGSASFPTLGFAVPHRAPSTHHRVSPPNPFSHVTTAPAPNSLRALFAPDKHTPAGPSSSDDKARHGMSVARRRRPSSSTSRSARPSARPGPRPAPAELQPNYKITQNKSDPQAWPGEASVAVFRPARALLDGRV